MDIYAGNNLDSKTSSLIKYILFQREGALITELMKLCYFIDIASKKKLGDKITSFDYIRYNYGPFDKKIYNFIKDEEIKEFEKLVGNEERVIYFVESQPETSLEEKEKNVVDEILGIFKDYTAKQLTAFAYQTYPMKNIGAKLGTDIAMNTPLAL